MRKTIGVLSTLLALGLAHIPTAQAFTLSVVPTTQTVSVGSLFNVDVIASGLTDGSAPSLGTYDIQVSFAGSTLEALEAQKGPGLSLNGVDSDFELSLANSTASVFELSFNSVADLDTLQSDSFRLFTLTFLAKEEGTSAVLLSPFVLGDAEGNELTADIVDGTVNVVSAVPLPGAAFLLLSGLGGAVTLLRGSGRARRARTAAATPAAR